MALTYRVSVTIHIFTAADTDAYINYGVSFFWLLRDPFAPHTPPHHNVGLVGGSWKEILYFRRQSILPSTCVAGRGESEN